MLFPGNGNLSKTSQRVLKSPWLHILSAAFIIVLLIIISKKRDIVIFPSIDVSNCSAYSDLISLHDSGNSIINCFRKEREKIVLDFTLSSTVAYPYAGFQWNYANSLLNLSNYSDLILTIDPDSTTVKSLLIILQVFCDGFSDSSNSMTLRFLTKELFLRKGVFQYFIPISDFVTPDWWYKRLNITEFDLGKPDLTQIDRINIQSSSDLNDTSKRIVIKDLRFIQKTSFRIYLIYFAIFCAFILVYFFIKMIIASNSKNHFSAVPIMYEKIEFENCADQQGRVVIEYIGKNFSNPELSLLRMSIDIGTPTYKISNIIKKNHNLTFKQYLNTIRIAEAKRLLKTSDLQVAQIAYRVGYSTAPHFNRIFKELTSQSPNAYRSSTEV